MSAKSTVMLAIVGATFVVVCCVSSAKFTYSDYLRRFNLDVMEYKHTRCFYPHNMNLMKKGNLESTKQIVQRWYYYAPTKSCRPLYSMPNLTYTIENPNYNLPRTREECEGLCGDFCVVNYRDGKNELGICTSLELNSMFVAESCKSVLPEIHPKQCPDKYSKCCPRDYARLANRLN